MTALLRDPRPRTPSKRDRVALILAEEIDDPAQVSRILARIDEEVELPTSVTSPGVRLTAGNPY